MDKLKSFLGIVGMFIVGLLVVGSMFFGTLGIFALLIYVVDFLIKSHGVFYVIAKGVYIVFQALLIIAGVLMVFIIGWGTVEEVQQYLLNRKEKQEDEI